MTLIEKLNQKIVELESRIASCKESIEKIESGEAGLSCSTEDQIRYSLKHWQEDLKKINHHIQLALWKIN